MGIRKRIKENWAWLLVFSVVWFFCLCYAIKLDISAKNFTLPGTIDHEIVHALQEEETQDY